MNKIRVISLFPNCNVKDVQYELNRICFFSQNSGKNNNIIDQFLTLIWRFTEIITKLEILVHKKMIPISGFMSIFTKILLIS